MTLTDQAIHAAAVRCNATVMGEEPHHYIMNADELRRFVVALQMPALPPCPVPAPNNTGDGA